MDFLNKFFHEWDTLIDIYLKKYLDTKKIYLEELNFLEFDLAKRIFPEKIFLSIKRLEVCNKLPQDLVTLLMFFLMSLRKDYPSMVLC
jgi:hypothetical protein